jgi:two-component sensor histidine kinase
MFASYTERNGFVYAGKPSNAKIQMRNGEIWFGGENSLYGFIPEKLSRRSNPLNVTLTDFKLFNTFIPLDSLLSLKEIRLKPEQNSFTIYFSSLSYAQQDNLLYYYKLDEVNDEWIKAERDLAANYTTLPSGNYTFKVKCVNLQGDESENITTLNLSILPHFYQTWWFFIIVIVAINWFAYYIYRQHIIKLLAVERIRSKVARDLHDDIGSTLSTINILSSMAKTKLLTDPVKSSTYISKITDNSQQMMEAMDDIVWSIKPDNDSMLKILARMREYTSGILEPKDVEITFNIGEHIQELKLNMETRRDLFLIFKEAVNNLAKYSHCTKAEINLKIRNQRLQMTVTDNGNGFDVNSADEGNGLGNMQKRAELLKGTIEIKSQQNLGTTVTLEIPVHT